MHLLCMLTSIKDTYPKNRNLHALWWAWAVNHSPPCRVVVGSNGDRRPHTLLTWEGWVWGPPYRPGNRGPTRSTCSFQLQAGSVCAFQNPKRTNCSGRVSKGSACAFQEPEMSNYFWQVRTWSTCAPTEAKTKKKIPENMRQYLTVMNPVHGLPLTHHKRLLAHHMDSCTTLTVALHLRLQFPSPIALTIHALNTQLIALNTLLIALNIQLIALITQPT